MAGGKTVCTSVSRAHYQGGPQYPFCQRCWGVLFASRCVVCKNAILGKCMVVSERRLHSTCFKCSDCSTSLNAVEFFTERAPLAPDADDIEDNLEMLENEQTAVSMFTCVTCHNKRVLRMDKHRNLGYCTVCKCRILDNEPWVASKVIHNY